MSRNVWAVLVIATLSGGVLQAQVPSADQVLQRYVTALGGQKELEKIHTQVLRGTLDLPDLKMKGTTVEYFSGPDHFAAISDITGYGKSTVVYDGRDGWQVGRDNKLTPISGADLADIQRRANIHWDLKLREFYPNIQNKGRESVNGEDAWKLEASLGNSTFDFFFSVKTGLLIRFDTDQHVPNGTSSVSISDYRRVGNVLFAFGAAQTAGRVKWTRTLTEVKFNGPIDDSVFAKPGKPESAPQAGSGRPTHRLSS